VGLVRGRKKHGRYTKLDENDRLVLSTRGASCNAVNVGQKKKIEAFFSNEEDSDDAQEVELQRDIIETKTIAEQQERVFSSDGSRTQESSVGAEEVSGIELEQK